MANENEIVPEKLAEPETEAAHEEFPVSQPEAEPGENAEEAPQPEPVAPVVVEAESEAGCPIEMGRYGGQLRCGRKLHAALEGVDEQPVCLMHSKDPDKQLGPLFDAFWLEFERILEEAGENKAHFEGFFIPRADFNRRTFKAICRFDRTTFMQSADFSGATFTQYALFSKAAFTQEVNFNIVIFMQNVFFNDSTFAQNAYFGNAKFMQNAYFSKVTFTKDAYFSGVTFTQNADFCGATFTQDADFGNTTFTQNADFGNTIFKQNAGFSRVTFTRNASFGDATFTQNVGFSNAIFKQNADFSRVNFKQDADFCEATFTQNVIFERIEFCGTADWHECKFLDQAEFRHIDFEPKEPGKPGAVFIMAKFAKPGEIVFEDVDLSRALFLNCDVSAVRFTSSVDWAERKGHRGLAVFEEEILLDPELSQIQEEYGEFDYDAVEQIYHQLHKNYDDRLDYRKANDFHYGEMEMRRLEPPSYGRLLTVRCILRPWMSLLNLYRITSDYGNSYTKPGKWLFRILLAATLLLPVTGLEMKQPLPGYPAIASYTSVWNQQDTWSNNRWTEAKLIGKSGITAIDTATFQRNPEYSPVYPWGRALGILETLLTSSLFALFLLAIRRQFRR
jgi:hypothetical protein